MKERNRIVIDLSEQGGNFIFYLEIHLLVKVKIYKFGLMQNWAM